MATWAERSTVENALVGWSDAQIACRAYQHTWRAHTVQHRPGVYTIIQRCSRCYNRRTQDMNEQGYPVSPWRMEYRDGYLLPSQSGRVGADGRAALRLATLRNLTIEEVPEDQDV